MAVLGGLWGYAGDALGPGCYQELNPSLELSKPMPHLMYHLQLLSVLSLKVSFTVENLCFIS